MKNLGEWVELARYNEKGISGGGDSGGKGMASLKGDAEAWELHLGG